MINDHLAITITFFYVKHLISGRRWPDRHSLIDTFELFIYKYMILTYAYRYLHIYFFTIFSFIQITSVAKAKVMCSFHVSMCGEWKIDKIENWRKAQRRKVKKKSKLWSAERENNNAIAFYFRISGECMHNSTKQSVSVELSSPKWLQCSHLGEVVTLVWRHDLLKWLW